MVHFIPVNNRKAGLIMVLAMLIIGFIDNYIAVIAETASLWQFQIMRAGLALPILLIISALGLGGLKPVRWWAVYFRSFLTALSMLFYFGSLAFVTFADALAGLFTAPIFVLLISVFFLRQPIGPIRIIAVVIGFLGILLVLGNTANEFSYISLLPAIGGFFYACGSVVTRQLCMGETTLSMLAALLIIQAIIGFIAVFCLSILGFDAPLGADGFILRTWVWDMSPFIWWVILQAVGATIGVGLIFKAYQIGDASYVSIYEYSVFIFGPAFAWLLMDQPIAVLQGLGILCITFSGILIAFRSG
jgi:drug/metabolite transporter (DMT)-like permease